MYLLWPTLAGGCFRFSFVAALTRWLARLFSSDREWGRRRETRPTDLAVRGVVCYKIHSY
jgi:hypothetical protein